MKTKNIQDDTLIFEEQLSNNPEFMAAVVAKIVSKLEIKIDVDIDDKTDAVIDWEIK